jgi:anti-anti-sigma regulatory factor
MPQEPLTINDSTHAGNGCRILCLKGPLLISNLFEFQARVRANTCRVLILDLTEVPYIGALVGAHVNHNKDGRSLALVGVAQRVTNSLKVAHVDTFFRCFGSVEAAESASS